MLGNEIHGPACSETKSMGVMLSKWRVKRRSNLSAAGERDRDEARNPTSAPTTKSLEIGCATRSQHPRENCTWSCSAQMSNRRGGRIVSSVRNPERKRTARRRGKTHVGAASSTKVCPPAFRRKASDTISVNSNIDTVGKESTWGGQPREAGNKIECATETAWTEVPSGRSHR